MLSVVSYIVEITMILVLFTVIITAVLLKIVCKLTLGKCNSTRRLDGKVALVTGSNRGIGYWTALNLAKRGARVIITSENLEDLNRAQKQMIQESGNQNISAKHLDFLSLAGVRKFCKEIIETETRLDILVNNAGSFAQGHKFTKDGLLPTIQINYIGQFLLTNLLLDLLKKSTPARIVNVASTASNISMFFDSNNINSVKFLPESDFKYLFEYCNSKVCTASSTIEMAKRLKGTGVTVNCLHPGIVDTCIYNNRNWGTFLANVGRYIVFKNPEEGAQTSIHLASCEKAEGVTGKYYADCKQSWVTTNLSSEVRERVWEQSVKLAGLKPEEMCI